jgi:hypothetical protein
MACPHGQREEKLTQFYTSEQSKVLGNQLFKISSESMWLVLISLLKKDPIPSSVISMKD